MIHRFFNLIKKLTFSFSLLILINSNSYSIDKNEIGWHDLIPWTAIFTSGEVKFNKKLDGKIVKIPGYIVPLDYSGTGVTEFMLVPYVGACIHVPPPPPNQLVYVTTDKPWDTMTLWEPVWVTGEIIVKIQTNEWAETGYEISADKIEFYDY
ncbi:DUF3299 domain-containing protein [Pelagibacterales bacterium]|jgi:hypothetical protein|nr:DUF3299 domain-containing protein [Pelagibacterales bacterium]